MQNPYTAAQPRFTRLSKALSAALAAFCALTFAVPLTREYLALVPGRWVAGGPARRSSQRAVCINHHATTAPPVRRTLPCVWNLVTSSFVTPNPIKVRA